MFFCFTPQVAQAVPVVSYLPLNVGNTWTYTVNGTSSDTASVSAVSGSAAKALSFSDGEIDYFTNDASTGISLLKTFSPSQNINGCGNTPLTITASPAMVFAPPNVVLGTTTPTPSSGSLAIKMNCSARLMTLAATYTASSTISGPESVATGAGTFQAVRIVFSFTANYNGALSTSSATYWAASGVGIVKEVVTSSQGTPETYVLSSTNVIGRDGCAYLPSYATFQSELISARGVISGSGNPHPVWGVMMDRTGKVCAVAYTGASLTSQWFAGRLLAASLANTANAVSTDTQFFSSANLNQLGQFKGLMDIDGGGLQIDATRAYAGSSASFGTLKDPLVGLRPGGWLGSGGGLALMDPYGRSVGAIGIAGDTPCTDHNLAWTLRYLLKLDYVPGGVNLDTTRADNIIYYVVPPGAEFTHPECSPAETVQSSSLPVTGQ